MSGLTQATLPAQRPCEASASNTWQARLSLDFSKGPRRTFVHRSHRGPLSIQRAFYPENDVCHVTLLHPPGGVVSGDELLTEVCVNPGASAVVVAPGATKHYRSREAGQEGSVQHSGNARLNAVGLVRQQLTVNDGSLEWLPNEAIHFDGSVSRVDTRIELNNDARLIATDVQVFGRTAGNLPFETGHADIGLSVFNANHPTLLDRMRVSGVDFQKSAAGLRGYTVYGTLIATHATDDLVALVRSRICETNSKDGISTSEATQPVSRLSSSPSTLATSEPMCAVTLIEGLLVVRYLGDRSDIALKILRAVRDVIRPAVIGRQSHTPRIWST